MFLGRSPSAEVCIPGRYPAASCTVVGTYLPRGQRRGAALSQDHGVAEERGSARVGEDKVILQEGGMGEGEGEYESDERCRA